MKTDPNDSHSIWQEARFIQRAGQAGGASAASREVPLPSFFNQTSGRPPVSNPSVSPIAAAMRGIPQASS